MALEQKAEELYRLNEELDEHKRRIEDEADEMLRRREQKLSEFVPEFSAEPEIFGVSTREDGDNHRRVPPSPRIRRAAHASAIRSSGEEVAVASAQATAASPETSSGLVTPVLTGLGAQADGIGAGAIARVQKAQIRALEQRLQETTARLQAAEASVAELPILRQMLAAEKAARARTAKQTRAEIQKARRDAENTGAAAEEVKRLRLDLAAARKDARQWQQKAKVQIGESASTDVRLNRAVEDLQRCRQDLKAERARKADGKGAIADRIQEQDREIRLLERQRTELLAAFKKQARLIDVLKRQKMHIEAAKLLSFTEEEFIKTLDKGV